MRDARKLLFGQEAEKLIDKDKIQRTAVERVEQAGIVFLDEIDKVAGPQSQHGPDVSRQGVQRDLLLVPVRTVGQVSQTLGLHGQEAVPPAPRSKTPRSSGSGWRRPTRP